VRQVRELSARKQRIVVLVALLIAALAITVVPLSQSAGRADAQVSCDGNRASLSTSWGSTATPCVADTPTLLSIPANKTANVGCGTLFLQPCWETRWNVKSFKRAGPFNVKMADGTTKSLYRLEFSQMGVINSATLTSQNGNGNVVITPQSTAQFGDQTGMVNVWVEGSDTMLLDFTVLGIGFTCNDASWATVDSQLIGTISGLGIPLNVDKGCGINLHIYYMASSNANSAKTVQLPNATMAVTQ
jgi:hypothetical protein